MGLSIIDSTNSESTLWVNSWNWRPTAELIRSFGILDDERCEFIQMSGMCTTVSQEEAREIGRRLIDDVLGNLSDNERIKLNLERTTDPDDYVFYKGDDWERNYGATKDWLKQFAEFCLHCDGFFVT